MNGCWNIKTLYYGRVALPKSAFTPGFDDELIIDYPYLGYLLQNGKRNILVDTGISDKYIVNGKAWGGYPADAGKKYLIQSLKDIGIKPEDIDTVLITHLHNDHAGNCDLFTHANIICQHDEWINLLDPLPAQMVRGDYDMNLIPMLRGIKSFLRIEGDYELTEGVRIIKTAGHTLGSQSIVVQTPKGLRIIVGDHFHLLCMCFPFQTEICDMQGNYQKITPAPAVYGPTIPSSLVYEFYAYYKSTYKIRSIMPAYDPQYIITGHDPAHYVYGV